MPHSSTFTFVIDTPKGRQKVKRYARRLIHGLPSHKKKDRDEEKRYDRKD
jgi:hypothetical protein